MSFASVFDLSDLDGTNGFTLPGIDPGDFSGRSIASAGDINGDGIDDLIIGAPEADLNGNSGPGESYVVFGRDTLAGPGFGATLELASLNGSTGFTLPGIDPGDFSGYSVASAGDINGDGIDDVIVGAVFAAPNGKSAAGKS